MNNLNQTLDPQTQKELEEIKADKKKNVYSMGENASKTILSAVGAAFLGLVSIGLLQQAVRLTPVPEKKYLSSSAIYAENYKEDSPLEVLDQLYQTIKIADLESKLITQEKEENGSINYIHRPGSGKTLEEIELIEKACKYKPDYSKTSLDKESIKQMETLYVNNIGRNLKETMYGIEDNGWPFLGSALTLIGALGLGMTGLFNGINLGYELKDYVSNTLEEKKLMKREKSKE